MTKRTRFIDPESMTRFSSELDPVGFAGTSEEQHKLQALRATTAMKLSLILGDRIPVLAQNQIFDSRLFLGLLDPEAQGSEEADERDAFLWLVKKQYVRLALRAADGAGSRARQLPLSTAFAQTLRRPGFILSGWPEMTADERDHFAQIVSGETAEEPPRHLENAVEALRTVDEVLRRSSFVPVSEPDEPLSWFIRTELGQRTGAAPSAYLNGWFSKLRAFAEDTSERRSDEWESPFNPNLRSDWRKLIRLFKTTKELPINHSALNATSRLVDIAYNRRVARSIGAHFQREVAVDAESEQLLREDPDTLTLSKEAASLSERTREPWLSWCVVKDYLQTGRVPNERTAARFDRRQQILEDLNKALVTVEVDGAWMFRNRERLTRRLQEAAVGVGTAVITATGFVVLPQNPEAGPAAAGLAAAGAGALGAAGHALGKVDPVSRLRDLRISRGIRTLTAELRTDDS